MKQIGVVVAGYGMAGREFHSRLLALVPGFAVRGIVTASQERAARAAAECGCTVYPTLDLALKDADAGLVVLATPSGTHAELAIKAMNAGKHVVTDKVMCVSVDECEKMINASRRNGVLLTVFQNRRRDGDFLTVRKLMNDGALGTVRWIEMAWQGANLWNGWRGDSRQGGGRFFDLGSHMVDQLCCLFPQPVQSVYCRMRRDDPARDVDTEALLVVTFADGCTGVIDTSSMARIGKPRFYVRGTAGTFIKHGKDPQEACLRRDGNIDAAIEDPADYGTLKTADTERRVQTIPGRWRDFYENVHDVLTKGAQPEVTLEQALRVMEVMDAGVHSGREETVVRF